MKQIVFLCSALLIAVTFNICADETRSEKDADVSTIGTRQKAESLQAQIDDLKAQVATLQQQQKTPHNYTKSEIQDIKRLDVMNACFDKCRALCETPRCGNDSKEQKDNTGKCEMQCNEDYERAQKLSEHQTN
jgi:hypothetical protein